MVLKLLHLLDPEDLPLIIAARWLKSHAVEWNKTCKNIQWWSYKDNKHTKMVIIWVWVNTYRYIFNGMNIHLPAILMFTRGTRFWPIPKSEKFILGSMADSCGSPEKMPTKQPCAEHFSDLAATLLPRSSLERKKMAIQLNTPVVSRIN